MLSGAPEAAVGCLEWLSVHFVSLIGSTQQTAFLPHSNPQVGEVTQLEALERGCVYVYIIV